MQNDQDTVIQLQSLDVVAEAVIAGQATQIYWALQYRAFPLNLMTANGNESRWLCYSTARVEYPQSWTKVRTTWCAFLYFFFIRQSADREHLDTNLCLPCNKL